MRSIAAMSRHANLGMDPLRHGGELRAHRAGDPARAQPFAGVADDGLAEPAEKPRPAQRGPVEPAFDRDRAQCIGLGCRIDVAGGLDGIVVKRGDLRLTHARRGEPGRNVDIAQALDIREDFVGAGSAAGAGRGEGVADQHDARLAMA